MYAILHQLQILVLFLMVDPFLPVAFDQYLEGQEVAMVSFDFIPFKDSPGIDISTDWIDYEQDLEVLENIGIESGSSIINSLSLMFTFVGILILHLVFAYVIS